MRIVGACGPEGAARSTRVLALDCIPSRKNALFSSKTSRVKSISWLVRGSGCIGSVNPVWQRHQGPAGVKLTACILLIVGHQVVRVLPGVVGPWRGFHLERAVIVVGIAVLRVVARSLCRGLA